MILVLDADGLIKLAKISLLKALLRRFDCFISEEVFREAVVVGKMRLREDAFLVEKLVEEGLLKVMRAEKAPKASAMLERATGLGEGEKSTLRLFFNLNARAIVTDDLRFIKLLKRRSLPFITSAGAILLLYGERAISKSEALKYLNKLKPYISVKDYLAAKRWLERGSERRAP